MFIVFANFYQHFIQGFSKFFVLFTLLLKITGLLNLIPKAFKADDNKIVGIVCKANKMAINLSNKSKNSTYILNTEAIKKSNFLTPNAKKTFNHLRLAFIKALIFQHFDLKSNIQIKTNISNYAIDGILS